MTCGGVGGLRWETARKDRISMDFRLEVVPVSDVDLAKRDVADTFEIAEMLLGDGHDLIHKATGGWLHETGKKDRQHLLSFLDKHAAMSCTALRYAMEYLDQEQRAHYSNMTKIVELRESEGDGLDRPPDNPSSRRSPIMTDIQNRIHEGRRR